MRNNIKYFLLACLSILGILSKSQNLNTKDSLPVLRIENKKLLIILDSLIEFDRKCDFYDSNLVYIVHIQSAGNKSLIQFTSTHKLIRKGTEIGCFFIKGHNVLVRGTYNDTLFKKTRCKKRLNYYQPSDIIEPNRTVTIDIYEDDSYTQWDYKYYNGSFTKIL